MDTSNLKDSGIKWLGKIPSNWNLMKGKYLFKLRHSKGNKKNLELLSPTQEYGVIPQKLYENLTGMRPVKLKNNTNLNLMQSIHKGDFCISLRSFQGGFEYSKYNGVVSPAYQVFFPQKSLNRIYFKYLFKDKSFIQKINSYTMSLRDGKNISFVDFGNTYLPLPSIKEQNKIAIFLNNQCQKINKLSKNIQQEIIYLEGYRKSIITQAVTKGLNKNVPMKDSGIKWIGKIPENWQIPKFKYIASIFGRIGFRGYTVNDLVNPGEGAISLSPGNITNGHLDFKKTTYLKWKKYYESPEIMVNKSDILMVKTGSSFGKTAWVNNLPNKATINPQLIVIKNITINSKFLYYCMNSAWFQYQINNTIAGGTIPTMSQKKILNFIMLLPSKYEQNLIVDFLNKKNEEIDNLVKFKEEQLKYITQYKQSIIYEYVTGKKQVPDEEAK